MKKTININLGGLVFPIDEDAYDRLNNYIEALKRKFTNVDERNEIIQDIEYRFAELFSVDLSKTNEVITLEMVNKAIATMGEPEEIEEELENNENLGFSGANHSTTFNKKLFRDPDEKIFAGVLSGISKYIGVKDPIWLRIIMVLLFFAGFGSPVLIYILLWILMPEAKTASERLQMTGEPINLDNIEEQVKKNINADEIKRTSVRVTNKLGELMPLILKVIAICAIIFFGLNLLGLTFGLLGGGFMFSMFKPELISLILENSTLYYVFIISLFVLLSIPLFVASGLAIKLLTRKKINWVLSISIIFFMLVLSVSGIVYGAYNALKGFKYNAEQTNYVAINNPSTDELELMFPYEELKEELNLSINFGSENDDNSIKIDGIELLPSKKQIKINSVQVDIKTLTNDTIFKLSKTIYSKGKTIEDAEEKLEHISNSFDNVNDNTLAIPGLMTLENETQWRNQKLKYDLYIPIGKRVYFGENARKVINAVDISGNYSKKDLTGNTWEMTDAGLKCLSCDTIKEN